MHVLCSACPLAASVGHDPTEFCAVTLYLGLAQIADHKARALVGVKERS
jgi:hypothetical protein